MNVKKSNRTNIILYSKAQTFNWRNKKKNLETADRLSLSGNTQRTREEVNKSEHVLLIVFLTLLLVLDKHCGSISKKTSILLPVCPNNNPLTNLKTP